jgi:hypothetical protein
MDELQKALADIDKIPMISKSAKDKLKQDARRKYALQTQAGAVRDPETGLFKANDGKLYETLEEAQRGSEEARRMAELQETEEKTEEQLGELESLIKRSGAAQRQMAERVGARQQGQLMGQLQRSILGTGGEAQTLGALVPQIQEQGERGLLDRLTGIEAQTVQQLQQVPRLAIGQETTMAKLGQTQQQIQDQMARAIMSQETSRAQIQADIDRQPEWWEGIVGAAGTALGTAVGGPVGGAIGGALTSAFTRKPSAQRTSFGSGSLPGTEVLPGSSGYNIT